jgi:catechol 2,3-dioxygenase-like lactoylglutathione lyase family enzyme
VIKFEDLSHLAFEVTDLEESERFYVDLLGMQVQHRDQGELGHGRSVLANMTGQLLFLEKVGELSPRSRFSGPDPKKVPDPDGPRRYSGAHLAISVGSLAEYDELHARLEKYGVYSEGDIRASQRAPGEKSDYFYDPSGNRLQMIILPPSPAEASRTTG